MLEFDVLTDPDFRLGLQLEMDHKMRTARIKFAHSESGLAGDKPNSKHSPLLTLSIGLCRLRHKA